jgi:anti-sigma regulatory factor (Ser/Thr protein kinase)
MTPRRDLSPGLAADFAPVGITDDNTGAGHGRFPGKIFARNGVRSPGRGEDRFGWAKHQGDEGWVVPTVEMFVAAEPRSAGLARRFLRDTLVSWDASVYSDAAELVLTELVTNAVLHAKTDILVRVDLGRGALRLEVIDRSPRQPIARHYSSEATTGRGLGLVDAVAKRWGVQPDAAGKMVWAELVTEGATRRAAPDRADRDAPSRASAGEDIAARRSNVGPSDRATGLLREWAA